MAGLTVRETKAGSRPAGGYPANTPTLSARPLNLRTDTLVKPKPLSFRAVRRNQRHSRSGISRPVIGPMGLTPRSIL